ncbi:MAG: hypothetical protein LWX56_06660 [Ignavibacteria bacterium]|nr:hypothetical protein [Ignavibacteria bacterium]
MFEAVHGSAPDIAGQNIANPCALVLASAMMLDYIGEADAARRIETAVARVIESGKLVTKDINRESFVGTREMGDAIMKELDTLQ